MSVFKKIFGHPAIPILAGAVVVLVRSGHYIIRSWGVFLCWLWFSVNIGRQVHRQPWAPHEKSISFVFLSGIALVVTLVCMWWFLRTFLEERQIRPVVGIILKMQQ